MKGNMGSKQASTDIAGRKYVCGGTTIKRPVPKSKGANNSRGGR